MSGYTEEDGGFDWLVLVLIVVSLLFLALFSWHVYEIGYLRGQLDAVTGDMRYELVEHPSGARTWRKKNDD